MAHIAGPVVARSTGEMGGGALGSPRVRGIQYRFEDFTALADLVDAPPDARELELPRPDGLRDGEWVLVTITIGGETESIAACVVDRGDGFRLRFTERDWERLRDFAESSGPPSVPPARLQSLAERLQPPAGAKVLVVDDDLDLQQVVACVLRTSGFEVTSVSSAEEALVRMRQEPVDLVVLDCNLPGTTGIELCRTLRETPEYAALPVLFLSALSSPMEVGSALAAGANDFVGKPFRAPELRVRILELLRRRADSTSSLGP